MADNRMDMDDPNTEGIEYSDQAAEDREDEEPEWEDYASGLRAMEVLGLTDISNLASWSVSSYKTGLGVDALCEDDPLKYWQSDGPQPHYIDIHFSKRVSIERLSIFTDYASDESYTPSKIQILSGTGYHSLQEVITIDLNEPQGWRDISMSSLRDDGVLKSFLIRIKILSNHQNGKDTHVRAIKVYSPVKASATFEDEVIGFSTVKMLSETVIR